MIKRFLRELYLLPRGEQRAIILMALLLILGIFVRLGVQMLPGRDPPGMEDFMRHSRELMSTLAEADIQKDSVSPHTGARFQAMSAVVHPSGSSCQDILPFPININRTDSAGLIPLAGIGPVFAGRIIKYRNLLGGFVRVDQLEEVYGFKQETLQQIRKYILIDTTAIIFLDINDASFRTLLRHPYLELDDVKTLTNYKNFKGRILSSEELKEQQLLSDSTLDRVRPYLKFND